MSPIAPAIDALSAEVARLTAQHGQCVRVADLNILDRAGLLELHPPGLQSPNRACRMIKAADGWLALNLAREEDQELVPAWLECDFGNEPWVAIDMHAAKHKRAALLERANLLGLPAGGVGEMIRKTPHAPLIRMAAPTTAKRAAPVKVIDMSALWAGPMCGAILAAMGASVTKVESVRRPDPTHVSTPEFFTRLNGRKADLSLDFAAPADRTQVREEILAADILVTSARPRAFAALGLDPASIFTRNPALIWVAVSGYGWTGAAATRVAFGDDAAAAGGVVKWTPEGAPHFLGDALADPVTGLAAAEGALRALREGGGYIVDVSLAGSAAGAAAVCGLARAA